MQSEEWNWKKETNPTARMVYRLESRHGFVLEMEIEKFGLDWMWRGSYSNCRCSGVGCVEASEAEAMEAAQAFALADEEMVPRAVGGVGQYGYYDFDFTHPACKTQGKAQFVFASPDAPEPGARGAVDYLKKMVAAAKAERPGKILVLSDADGLGELGDGVVVRKRYVKGDDLDKWDHVVLTIPTAGESIPPLLARYRVSQAFARGLNNPESMVTFWIADPRFPLPRRFAGDVSGRIPARTVKAHNDMMFVIPSRFRTGITVNPVEKESRVFLVSGEFVHA